MRSQTYQISVTCSYRYCPLLVRMLSNDPGCQTSILTLKVLNFIKMSSKSAVTGLLAKTLKCQSCSVDFY